MFNKTKTYNWLNLKTKSTVAHYKLEITNKDFKKYNTLESNKNFPCLLVLNPPRNC